MKPPLFCEYIKCEDPFLAAAVNKKLTFRRSKKRRKHEVCTPFKKNELHCILQG